MITSFEKCSTVISASEKKKKKKLVYSHGGVFIHLSSQFQPPLSGPAVLFLLK